MKKFLSFILFILTLLPFKGRAEAIYDEPGSFRFLWGVKAGIDLVTADKLLGVPKIDLNKGGLGVNAGFTWRFIWRNHWYVQPGLSLAYDTQGVLLAPLEGAVHDQYASIRRGAAMLPIQLGYRFGLSWNFAMSVFSGVWTSYSFVGTLADDNGGALSMLTSNYKTLYGNDGIWNRLSAGPLFGLTFEGPDVPLSLCIEAGFGVTQMARKDIFRYPYMTESIARVSFVYWFRR